MFCEGKTRGDKESLGNHVFEYHQQTNLNQYNETLEAFYNNDEADLEFEMDYLEFLVEAIDP